MNTRNIILVTGVRGAGKTSFCRAFARSRGVRARHVLFDKFAREHPWKMKFLSEARPLKKSLLNAVIGMEICDDFVHHVEAIKASHTIIDTNKYFIFDRGLHFVPDFELWRRLAPTYVLFVTDEPARIRERRQKMNPRVIPSSAERIGAVQNGMLRHARLVMDWYDIPLIELSLKKPETFRAEMR